jgi:hypothetical protein
MKKFHFSLLVTGLLVFTSALAGDDDAGLFAKGKKQVTVLGGSGYAFDETYFVIGGGVSYFVMDGLNVGVQAEAWTGGDPSIYKYTLSSNYVFYKTPRVAPYVGVFYRYTDIESRDSIESVGGRAGAYLKIGSNGYAGFGAVYESYLDCNPRIYGSCDEVYPEISFTFAF